MNEIEILSKCDHTNLSQTATFDDIKILLDDGIKYGVASCCIQRLFPKGPLWKYRRL